MNYRLLKRLTVGALSFICFLLLLVSQSFAQTATPAAGGETGDNDLPYLRGNDAGSVTSATTGADGAFANALAAPCGTRFSSNIFTIWLPDNAGVSTGGTIYNSAGTHAPARLCFHDRAGTAIATTTLTCPGAAVNQAVGSISLADGASCSLMGVANAGTGGNPVTYAATLSRSGLVYTVGAGTATGDVFGGGIPLPTVTNVSPNSGPTAGGTPVTITGTGFTGATSVTFDGVAATGLNVINDTTIMATTPAGTAGPASVLVSSPGGTSAANMLFTYGDTGTITIIKDTVPDSGQDFDFTTTGMLTPSTFSLDDDADGTLPNTQTFANVMAGTYTVTETTVAGFNTSVSCVDPDGGSTAAGATATIDLDIGETVTCTFTNSDAVAPSVAINGAPATFSGTTPFTVVFNFSEDVINFDDVGDITLGNAIASNFQSVNGSTYTADITPDGSARNITIDVAAGVAQDGAGNPNTAAPQVAVASTIVSETQRIIRNFISGRMDTIISNEPLIYDRLNGGGRGGQGNPVGFSAGGRSGDDINMSFHTSLGAIVAESRREKLQDLAAIKKGLALVDDPIPNRSANEERLGFDIWAKGKYARVRNASQRSDVGLLYLGADYRHNADLVLGVLGQMDWTKEQNRSANTSASGFGWLLGPYLIARLQDNLIFDGRIAFGASDNKVSPLGTFRDKFDTTRWLAKAELTGDFAIGDVIFNPFLGAIYYEETQHGYTDSLGNRIPRQTLSLGRIRFGPKFSTEVTLIDGTVIAPHVTISGLYDFDRARQTNAQGRAINSSTIRSKVEGGVAITMPHGWHLNGTGFYDGIGTGRLESYGGGMTVVVPLN